MPSAKVAVSIEAKLLREVDRWVEAGEYPNRSRAVQDGLLSLRDRRARGPRPLRGPSKIKPQAEGGVGGGRVGGREPGAARREEGGARRGEAGGAGGGRT